MREGLTKAELDMLEKAKAQEAEKEILYQERAKREGEKYGQLIEMLKLYAMVPASVFRFVRVCDVLKNCFQVACRGEVDSEVATYRWLRVGLELLKANPHEKLSGDAYFNFTDEEQGLMTAALKPFFSYLIKWAKKMLPRHEDTYYIDELEVTVENAIIGPMGPQPFDAPSQTEWDFIFERDENIGAVEYTGNVFNGLLRHCTAEEWKCPAYKVVAVAAMGFPDELREEVRLAMHCSRVEYLAERGRFEAMYRQVKQGFKASQTLQTGNEPDWASLRNEFRECGAGQEWYILPNAKKWAELHAKLKQYVEQRQEAVSAALRPPEPEPPQKDTLHTIGDSLISQIGSLSVSGDYRGIGVAFLLSSLESIIRECLRSKQWGVFGNPLYIKTVIAIQAQSGFSCEKGTEDQSIEGAWKSLSNVFRVYFRSFVQMVKCKKLPDVESWIKKNPSMTYSVEDSPSAPEASGYRGLSAAVCGGLFDVSQAIAGECYGDESDRILNLYADIFPADVDWYAFPLLQDKSVPIEVRYSPIEDTLKEQQFKAPSMDCFRCTCRALVQGLAIANQCGDSKLPSRSWLKMGLQILAQNPQGRLTYQNQHLQYYDNNGCDWIMNAFEPVAIAFRDWAAAFMPKWDPDVTPEEIADGSGIPLADKVDEIMRSVYRLDDGEDRWTLHTAELIFERTNDYAYRRYKTTMFDQMLNALSSDGGEVELVPVKEREVLKMNEKTSRVTSGAPEDATEPRFSGETLGGCECDALSKSTSAHEANRDIREINGQKLFCGKIEPGKYASRVLILSRCRFPDGTDEFATSQEGCAVGTIHIKGVARDFNIPLTSVKNWQVIKALVETEDEAEGYVQLDSNWRSDFKRVQANNYSNLDAWDFARYVHSKHGRGRRPKEIAPDDLCKYHILTTPRNK